MPAFAEDHSARAPSHDGLRSTQRHGARDIEFVVKIGDPKQGILHRRTAAVECLEADLNDQRSSHSRRYGEPFNLDGMKCPARFRVDLDNHDANDD